MLFNYKKCRAIANSCTRDESSPFWILIYILIVPFIILLFLFMVYIIGLLGCSLGIDIVNNNDDSICNESYFVSGTLYTFILTVIIITIVCCYTNIKDTCMVISMILGVIILFWMPYFISVIYSKYISPIYVHIDNKIVICHVQFVNECYGEGLLMIFVLIVFVLFIIICKWGLDDFNNRLNEVENKFV